MRKIVSSFLVFLVFLMGVLTPATTVSAASVKIQNGKTYTAKQIADANLSQGIIRWGDDMVSGYIMVEPVDKKGKKFHVSIREITRDGLSAHPTSKQLLRGFSESAFWDIRRYAQTKGYWDCDWNIKSNTGSKLIATAKVAYYAVKATEKSRELTITQVTTKKGDSYSTYYKVDGKKYSAAKLKKLFK